MNAVSSSTSVVPSEVITPTPLLYLLMYIPSHLSVCPLYIIASTDLNVYTYTQCMCTSQLVHLDNIGLPAWFYKAHLEWLGIRPHYLLEVSMYFRCGYKSMLVQECPTCSSVLAHLSTRCGVHSDTLHNYVQLCI